LGVSIRQVKVYSHRLDNGNAMTYKVGGRAPNGTITQIHAHEDGQNFHIDICVNDPQYPGQDIYWKTITNAVTEIEYEARAIHEDKAV